MAEMAGTFAIHAALAHGGNSYLHRVILSFMQPRARTATTRLRSPRAARSGRVPCSSTSPSSRSARSRRRMATSHWRASSTPSSVRLVFATARSGAFVAPARSERTAFFKADATPGTDRLHRRPIPPPVMALMDLRRSYPYPSAVSSAARIAGSTRHAHRATTTRADCPVGSPWLSARFPATILPTILSATFRSVLGDRFGIRHKTICCQHIDANRKLDCGVNGRRKRKLLKPCKESVSLLPCDTASERANLA